jgi:hypothetical protein
VTRKIAIGVPVGWFLNTIWQGSFEQWYNGPHTDELVFMREPSNTKAVSYSNLIRQTYEHDLDGLLLLETNILNEMPVETVLQRTKQFHAMLTPGRFQDETIGCEPVFLDDSRAAAHDYPTEEYTLANGEPYREFSPIEVRWGCTHFVWMDRVVISALVHRGQRFMWAKKSTKLDHDMPIYCYDGDTFPDHPDPVVRQDKEPINPSRRLAIEQSLYSNIRQLGFGVWADPIIHTTNLRLGGAYRSLRYEDYK